MATTPRTQSVRRALAKPLAAWAASLLLAACAWTPSLPLEPSDLALPPGSRILVAEAEKNLFQLRIKPLSRSLSAPDSISVVTVDAVLSGGSLQALLKPALEKKPSSTVLLLVADRIVERHYNAYRHFAGWRTESVIEGYENGRPVARKREMPQFETRYRNRCVRVRYRIFQYGPDAEAMGQVAPTPGTPGTPEQCPEKSDADVVIDEIGAALRWVEERLRAAGPVETEIKEREKRKEKQGKRNDKP